MSLSLHSLGLSYSLLPLYYPKGSVPGQPLQALRNFDTNTNPFPLSILSIQRFELSSGISRYNPLSTPTPGLKLGHPLPLNVLDSGLRVHSYFLWTFQKEWLLQGTILELHGSPVTSGAHYSRSEDLRKLGVQIDVKYFQRSNCNKIEYTDSLYKLSVQAQTGGRQREADLACPAPPPL